MPSLSWRVMPPDIFVVPCDICQVLLGFLSADAQQLCAWVIWGCFSESSRSYQMRHLESGTINSNPEACVKSNLGHTWMADLSERV